MSDATLRSRPTIVLAHGYPVVAAANPVRGVASDTTALTSLLAGIDGSLVPVGHFYGGMPSDAPLCKGEYQ